LEEGQRRDLEAVIREGWNETAGAFTWYFGSDALDASNLMLPIVGFLPADDPRMPSTISAIEERLTDERGLVYRYRTEEGVRRPCRRRGNLPALHLLAGRGASPRGAGGPASRGVRASGRLCQRRRPASRGDRPDTGELLGNFPQAFSHIGLVNAAWAIVQAELRTESSR
jgi:hypothetical protein